MSKIMKKITLALILIIAILGMFSFVNAADTVVNTPVALRKFFEFGDGKLNLPQLNYDPTPAQGGTGLMPQYFLDGKYEKSKEDAQRTVTLPEERTSLDTTSWDVMIDGQIAFCSKKGGWVRYGEYDTETHYLYRTINIQGKDLSIEKISSNPYYLKLKGSSEAEQTYVNLISEYVDINYSTDRNTTYTVSNVSYQDVWDTVHSNNEEGIIDALAIGYTSSDDSSQKRKDETLILIRVGIKEALVNVKSISTTYDSSTEGDGLNNEESLDGMKLGSIVVLENDEHEAGYHETTGGTFQSTVDKLKGLLDDPSKQSQLKQVQSEIVKSYIFTAAENVYNYKYGTCALKYDLNDIQSAYWEVLYKYDGTSRNPGEYYTAGGQKLFERAENFLKFVEEVARNGYEPTINKESAKVIVNKENQSYIIGPISITYPYYYDMSYIKALTLETDNGLKLFYSEENSDFEIVLNKSVSGSNGTAKEYPKSGADFFIVVKADKIQGATKLNIGAKFEYLNFAEMEYKYLDTSANKYYYRLYFKNVGVRTVISYDLTATTKHTTRVHTDTCDNFFIDYTYTAKNCPCTAKVTHTDACIAAQVCEGCKSGGGHKKACKNLRQGYNQDPNKCACGGVYSHADDCTFGVKTYKSDVYSCPCGGKDETYTTTVNNYNQKFNTNSNPVNDTNVNLYRSYIQPYIKLDEEPTENLGAQKMIVTGAGKRTYVTKDVSVEDWIDITIDLGGYVWVDGEAGKEDVYNGLMDAGEKRVSNVRVCLYEVGKEAELAQAITDSEGKYLFEDLDAMKEYYIRFLYNGQYYEPTTFTSPLNATNGWGKGNWKVNSNADEYANERTNLNNRFSTINSTPNNYSGNGNTQSYTRAQLLSSGVIDEFGNILKNDSSSMSAYARDCLISAYTNSAGDYSYPTPTIFILDNKKDVKQLKIIDTNQEKVGMSSLEIEMLYDNAYYINLGLHPRKEADIALRTEIDNVTLEINGQTKKYPYSERQADGKDYWEINVRLSDAYYKTDYSRDIYKEDYLYKVSAYGNPEIYGKTKEDELDVYVTYKIMVRNQSLSIDARINEIVDYYDSDLDYVPERSYVDIKSNKYVIKTSSSSMCGAITETNIPGYNKLYVQDIGNGIYLGGGDTANVYLTFKVSKEARDGENWIKLDENYLTGQAIGVGKENIAELNSYSTRYSAGTYVPNRGNVGGTNAGLVDKDSNPGNLIAAYVPKDGTVQYATFEDDTDKAPNLRIVLDRTNSRIISGAVWEDARTKEIGVVTIGDGIKDNNETLINGVTVQLVELMENGTEFMWKEFEGGTGMTASTTPILAGGIVSNYNFTGDYRGQYAFKSFVPGRYVVRFKYGDKTATAVPNTLGGANEKAYNGQDYKSTTYQVGVDQNVTYYWRPESTWVNGQEIIPNNILGTVSGLNADASNNETFNLKTNLTNGYLFIRNDKTNISNAKDIGSARNIVNSYAKANATNYIAEVLSGKNSSYVNDLIQKANMTAETGLIPILIEDNEISNVNLGLEERPKAQLIVDKKITNVRVTLANGTILFDAKSAANNVLWKANKGYNVSYNRNLLSTLESIKNTNTSGIVNLFMDEEIMHGATITITYGITVTNIGEVDYEDNKFYYTGVKSNNAKVVTTSAKVIDYVSNNLQFFVADNSNWKIISNEDIKSQGLVNSGITDSTNKYNTKIVADLLNTNLVPTLYKEKVDKNAQNSVTIPLVLTQLITSENETDDLTYKNIVEIVATNNTAGRRMEYSIVGNQNPTIEPQEIDSNNSEVVKILPPFGGTPNYIIISTITIMTVGIILVGVVLIKKKVLKK